MEIQKKKLPLLATKHEIGMEVVKKATNRKLTMSYDHPVDERFPLVTLTLPQLYKLRANCTLDTGVTWHTPAEKITYKQLYTQGMRLAKGLLALGLRRGDTVLSVGVDGSESALLFIAATMIGVTFAAPYIYSPLEGNINYHIQNVKPKLIILGNTLTGSNLVDPYPIVLQCLSKLANEDSQFSLPVVYREKGSIHTESSGLNDPRLKDIDYVEKLMEVGEIISDETLETKMSEVTSNEPCFYTMSSGSTGIPKTIVIGAALFVNGGSRRIDRWCVTSSSRMGCPSMCTEDIGFVEDLTSGFYTGHEILAVPAATSWDCNDTCRIMLEAFEKHRTQMVFADQYFLTYLVNNPNLMQDYDVSSLRGLILGGSSMSPSFKESVVNIFPDSLDWYGLSEYYCGMFAALGSMKKNLKTVGRTAVNQEVKVVDEEGNIVPVNSRGELWIRGYGLFLEYKDQPELTKNVVTEDGWFKSGDCAVMDEDGEIQIVGRMTSSERYKVSSDVVYAQPIEKVMRTCPKILDIVVVGRATGTTVGDEIVYCVILKENQNMTMEDVYTFAVDHMETSNEWPLRVFFYKEFPRHGARNKVSRKTLAKEIEALVEEDYWINCVDKSYLEHYQ